MSGVKALRKIQFGQETAGGTAVAATTVWRGMGTIEDQRETVFVEEDVGILGGVDRTYVPKLGAVITLEDTPATFEQLPYLFESATDATAGVADGVGSGYIYTYNLPTTAVLAPQTLTVEAGDNQQAEEVEYCFVEDLTLSGAAGEALMMGATLRGRQVTKTTYTGAQSIPDVEEILVSKGKLYIDAVAGTAGTTQVSNTLLAVSINWTTGLIVKHSLDGSLYFSFLQSTPAEVLLELTFEHNASAITEKDAWIAETPRLIQLKFEGSALETAGAYTLKTHTATFAGKWETFAALSDQDGNDIIVGTFRSRYNGTAALQGQMIVVNSLSALP